MAAEERIQELERRLASQQEAGSSHQPGAGEPPAMAAPGMQAVLLSLLTCDLCFVGRVPTICEVPWCKSWVTACPRANRNQNKQLPVVCLHAGLFSMQKQL